ncbi:MAG TPA: class IV adenylate cyclase [Acidobacteriaceae bacterium]|jgi:adenylate cyclase class 2
MQSAEIELKFPIQDLPRLQSQLPGLGFLLDTPRTFEQNTLYDTADRTLRATKQILRLRRYGSLWTVTHKRQPLGAPNDDLTPSRYKIRIETETKVDDGPALGAIFEQMGYTPVFRYEKFRTEWSQIASTIDGPLFSAASQSIEAVALPPRSHLVIDETPIGDYAELEGPPAWIDETLARLDVDPASCITESYGRLFLAWKARTGSPAENLTYDEIPVAELLQPALH